MATTATTTSGVTASGVASRRSIASHRAHRGGGRATTAAAARDGDDDGPAVVKVGRRPRVHRARRARTRAASEEEIQRIRERMYDFDDGEIGLEAFGRVSRDGGAATTTTTTLGGATRFARSSIFHRIASVSAMLPAPAAVLPVAPPAATDVNVHVRAAGNVSVTATPVAADGPALDTTMVYIRSS